MFVDIIFIMQAYPLLFSIMFIDTISTQALILHWFILKLMNYSLILLNN